MAVKRARLRVEPTAHGSGSVRKVFSAANGTGKRGACAPSAGERRLPHFPERYRRVVLLGLWTVLALVLAGRWLNATNIGGQQPAEPFRIAGSCDEADANDVAALLSGWTAQCPRSLRLWSRLQNGIRDYTSGLASGALRA